MKLANDFRLREEGTKMYHIGFDGYSFDVAAREYSDGDHVELFNIFVDDHSVKEIYIPRDLPSGQKIDGILNIDNMYDYVKGKPRKRGNGHLDKIIIDDSISFIDDSAFERIDVDEVHWPSSCSEILPETFRYSTIQKISGIENVSVVHNHAFATTGLKSIDWPAACTTIPIFCFMDSALETISGIENVTKISIGAFANSQLKSLDFLQPYCEIGMSSFCHIDPSAINFPYFTEEVQRTEAFCDKFYN